MQFAKSANVMERLMVSHLGRHCCHRRSVSALSLSRPTISAVVPAAPANYLLSVRFSTSSDKSSEPIDVTNEPATKPHFTQTLPGPHKYAPDAVTTPNAVDGEPVWENPTNHAVYDLNKIDTIPLTHHEMTKMHERVAYYAVKTARLCFDLASGYRGPGGKMTERDWLHRCLFLESVAGVPGMVGGMLRHLRSLRLLRRDYGWIHTLLEEAENERMHLLIFMNLKQPGWFFRSLVIGAQVFFFTGFFVSYMFSPRTCHRFVGYLEEEAVKTYSGLLKDIEDGHLDEWKERTAPLIGRTYYKLPDDATLYDMIKCIRADEANHRDVNHTFANLDQKKGVSPFVHGHHDKDKGKPKIDK